MTLRLSALVLALTPVLLAAQQPTFSSRAESVRVDVLVTAGGRPVRDLQPADFEVRDEGVLQQVDLATFEQVPISLVLALDASYSVRGQPLEQLQQAGHALLDGLRRDDRAALVTFDSKVSLHGRATADVASLRGLLDTLSAAPIDEAGGTSVMDATYAAMVASEADGHRPLVIVFSDGVDTGSWTTSARVTDAARRLSAVVYGVTVRGSAGTPFLRELTQVAGGDVVEMDSIGQVRSTFVRILEEFRSRYMVSYSPRDVKGSGWHRLEVRVKGRRVNVRARAGYVAGS